MKKTVFCILLSLTSLNLLAQITADQLDGNNTSACYSSGGYCASPFQPMVNSSVVPADTYNIVPGNVSKVSIKDLLYSDTTSQATKDATKAFVHFVGWFCTDEDGNTCEGHVKTGYKSDDQSTVDAQLGDIQQRGFDGLVFDWYGPRNQSTSISRIERTANLVRTEIAGTSLQFAIMEDQGAWDGADVCGRTNPSCIQNAIIFDITQAQSEYFSSPNYLTVSGRPVMFFFIIR